VDIGKRVRELRDEKGLYQEELAQKAGVARNTISRIERGVLKPTVSLLEKLAVGLEVDTADFLRDRAPLAKPSTPALRFLQESREFEEEAKEHPVSAVKKLRSLAHSYVFAEKYLETLKDPETRKEAEAQVREGLRHRHWAYMYIMTSPDTAEQLEWRSKEFDRAEQIERRGLAAS